MPEVLVADKLSPAQMFTSLAAAMTGKMLTAHDVVGLPQ